MEPIKFRDMTPDQRSKIVEALVADAASVESYQPDGVWMGKRNSFIHLSSCYRLKPRQLVIPWGVLRPEIVYVAMDADGHVFGYSTLPDVGTSAWGSWHAQARIDHILPIDTIGIDWRESLVMRPGYEAGEE